MINALRPRGAVLAALALWAVCLLLLAAAGLGGRVGPHPDNGSLVPPMPEVRLSAVGSRLGPASDYMEIGSRPLLSADRRPAPVSAAGEGEGDKPLEVTLTSVLIAGDVKLAIVQGKDDGKSLRVRLGELIEGTAWRLVALEPRSAVFDGPQGRTELVLRVYDGGSGTVPVSGPRSAPPGGNAEPATGKADSEPGAVAAAPAAPVPENAELSQEQQVEAIRRRIEARRAQMRAESARRNDQQVE